ncbi:MAG: hypothetical protein JF565_03830 [Propionibacteriales bacterium]|nr:hypothetical protein [Propionibacteriales bacterium]
MTTRASSGRTALLAAMVVALTAAVLTLAGTTPRGIGAPVQTFERVELDQRTFACGGGLPDATASHGNVVNGLAAAVPIGDAAQVFDDDKSVALGAFAGQESRSKDWLAWLPCPEPRARWWFVGAGAATVSHDTVLTITNPRAGQAVLDVNVFGGDGPVQGPGLHGITIPAGGTQVIDLAKAAPSVGDLAVNLVARRGLVSVSAADRFAPGFVGKAVQEWLPGQPVPSTSVTMTGLPARPDHATLVVANPRQVDAIVSVQVVGATGTFAPKDTSTLTVPADSVASLPIESVFNGDPIAIRVTSEQPVTASVRTVTGGDVAFGTGVGPVTGTTAFAVPSGSADVVLSSLGPASSITLTAFAASGKQLLDKAVAVPKASSVATPLPEGARYVRLVATAADAVAGFSVTDPVGIATGGVSPAIRSVLLPVVRPGW